jgi:glycosyltransferase involved in cell wall biosynthesis
MNSVTVIIPTREHPETLLATLRTVIQQDYDRLEIIVSDNFSNDSTEDVVRSFTDRRVKYINTGKRLSMSENWDFALSHATGDWISVLGDDDGFLPNCVSRTMELASAACVDAVRSTLCTYKWPNADPDGRSSLAVPISCGYERRSSRTWVKRVLQGLDLYKALPMLYVGGFVRSSVLERIRKEGRFFRSCIPDVYSAIAIANATDSYLYSFEPLAIGGTSPKSNGASHGRKDTSPGSPIQKFLSEGNLPFHPLVPMDVDGGYPKSIEAITFESMNQVKAVIPNAITISSEEQLVVILEHARRRGVNLDEWAKRFAEVNGINLDTVCLKSNYAWELVLQFRATMKRKLITSANESDVSDVYQASVVADRIMASRTGMTKLLSRWCNTFFRS